MCYLRCYFYPGCGERSVDPHSCVVLSRQRADEPFIRNRIYHALRQHTQHVPRVSPGRGRSNDRNSHILGRLGPPLITGQLACLVPSCLHRRNNGLRLVQRRPRRNTRRN